MDDHVPAPKKMANSPSPSPRSKSALHSLLNEADGAFDLKCKGMLLAGSRTIRDRRAARFTGSGFPDLHREKSQELFSANGPWAETLCDAVQHFKRLAGTELIAEHVDAGVLWALVGGRGSGKTQLATCLARYAVAVGHKPMYVTAAQLFRKVRATYSNREASEQQVIDSLTETKLLVIDEFHDRAETPSEARLLNTVIDKRYTQGYLTLMISNETPERFAESIGPSIASRFEEAGEIITVNWASFRTPKFKAS